MKGPDVLALPPLRAGHAAPGDLVARREGIAAAGPPAQMPNGVTLERTELGGVTCVVCAPAAPVADVLYFHGGGYRLGSAEAWAGLAGELATSLNARIVVADYRLAPEDPFPAALHDAAAVYAAVLAGSDRPVVVGGDSAGGGLAVSLALALRDGEVRAPAAVLLLSPWVDLTVSARSYTTNAASDQLFSAGSASDAAVLYLQGHDARDPLVSPALGELRGAPPTMVFVSAHEVLLDDACSLTHSLGAAGVGVELHVVPDMPHVWPFMLPDHEASQRALEDIARFVRRVLA